jgi:hypothetical protein
VQIRDAIVSWVRARGPRLSVAALTDEAVPRWARVPQAPGACPTAQ